MSLSLETEYVPPDNLPLEKCRYCDRRFFKESLTKHEHACEKVWMRGNCKKEQKSEVTKPPGIKEHITGYNVNVKTFGEMLSLGCERRQRWRLRHAEFIHTVQSAKATSVRENGGIPDVIAPLSAEITLAGLTQCQFCRRRFNDAAIEKHQNQCKEKSEQSIPQQTEEHKEARSRFLKRMRYSLKIINGSEEALADEDEQPMATVAEVSKDDTIDGETTPTPGSAIKHSSPPSSASPSVSPTPVAAADAAAPSNVLAVLREQDIFQKLAAELCAGAMGGNGAPAIPPELLQSDIFNKLMQQNFPNLLPFTPQQISNCNRSDGSESLMANSCASLIDNAGGGRGGGPGGGGVDSESTNLTSPSAISSLSSLSALLANTGITPGLSAIDFTSTAATGAELLTSEKISRTHKKKGHRTANTVPGSDLNMDPRLLTEGNAEKAPTTARSSHSHRICKPPPTVVNNFMVEAVDPMSKKKKQRSCKNSEDVGASEPGVSTDDAKEERRKGCRGSRRSTNATDGDNDSPVVFYKFQEDETFTEQSEQKQPIQKVKQSSRHKEISDKPDTKSSMRCVRDGASLRITDPSRTSKREVKLDGIAAHPSTEAPSNDVTESIVSKKGSHHRSSHHKSHHGHTHNSRPSGLDGAPGPSPISSVAPAAASSSTRRCHQCGIKNPREACFCDSCGAVRQPDATPSSGATPRHSIIISSHTKGGD